MTTIAVDKHSIAWDTQITWGNERMASPAKKVRVIDGVIFALAGDYGRFDQCVAWWQGGKPENGAPKGSWTLLVIESPSMMHLYMNTALAGLRVAPPLALGSGDQFALGRFDAPNATAKEAVKSSMRHDVYTGGTVKTLRFDKVWPKVKTRSKSR